MRRMKRKLLYTSRHPETIPSIHPIPSNPLIAYAARSVSDGIIFAWGFSFWNYFSQTNSNASFKHMEVIFERKETQKRTDWSKSSLLETLFYRNSVILREAYPFQNGWIFEKVPNGRWPPPLIFGKSCCRFFYKAIHTLKNPFVLFSCKKKALFKSPNFAT